MSTTKKHPTRVLTFLEEYETVHKAAKRKAGRKRLCASCLIVGAVYFAAAVLGIIEWAIAKETMVSVGSAAVYWLLFGSVEG